jgi:hypothetical protein
VFVRDGLRTYRRTYRPAEARWGVATGAALVGVVGWVGWKGAHPDPALFDMSAALQADPGSTGSPATDGSADRGPFPPGLAGETLVEGKISRYPADDLYVKINGRAGYFQSFGVRDLYALTLETRPGQGAGSPASIDIELYDMGEGQNAIGAYNGERPPDMASNVESGAAFHVDRNAAFLARGRYYLRLIGSDESEPLRREVGRLLEAFREGLPAEALPWAFALYVDQMKLPASRVTYVKSNAFSFGFASDVFTALLSEPDATDDVEAFVVACSDASAAEDLARQFRDGFASLGEAAGTIGAEGPAAYRDQFLGTLATATASERWVVGIRGAATPTDVEQALAAMAAGLRALPADVRERALPTEAPAPPAAAGQDEAGKAEYDAEK